MFPLHLPLYRVQRLFRGGLLLPASYTFSVLSACNARCLTCRAAERATEELRADEYERIARSIRQPGFWITLTGGEPFLRRDLARIATALLEGIRPRLVTLPTNGSLPDRVVETVEGLAEKWPSVRFIVNVSLDEIGPRHDELRGMPGGFELALETVRGLRLLERRLRNVTLGIHTVISRFNVARFPEVCDGLLALEPDSYVVEVAQQRLELGTLGQDLAPASEAWARAVAHLRERVLSRRTTRLGRLIAALRDEYYRDVQHLLEGGGALRGCLAGTVSAYVSPDGEVLACPVRGGAIGHLREEAYDFPSVWQGSRARSVRENIARERCACTLANQAYLNLAADPVALLRLGVRTGARALRRPPAPQT